MTPSIPKKIQRKILRILVLGEPPRRRV